ncbi:MAG: aminoglycoside phosphotransferase (APT) family kinase protein [Halobacteriales archaeon]|jgi:aminoglycoside phosphotransferase (APT) family kinase protein
MQYDTSLSWNELDRMVTTIVPSWDLDEATPTEGGHHVVYRLAVDTPDGTRECYLKATPQEKSPSVNLEARLLAILNAETDIPVPPVVGTVDHHGSLPAPFVLLEALPGQTTHRTELPSLSDRTLRTVARDTGRYLAALHALDAVDAYGFLTADGPALGGERPSGAVGTVTVEDPIWDWQERLHEWASGTVTQLEGTQFADIAPDAEPVIRSRIDDVEGPFEPALARIDNALENVLLEDNTVSAMLDWEFSIAATPDYDIVNVAWSLAGGPYLFAPDVPDRRDLVREALLDGYRERGPTAVEEQTRANRDCYELLSALRSMTHLADWYELFDLDGEIDTAAATLRCEVESRL